MFKEFNEIVEESRDYPFPVNEAFVRLNKGKYSKYRLNEIERKWMNITQNAFKHRKVNTMSEEDKIFFDILNATNEYRKSKNIIARSSMENGEGSISILATDKK